MKPILCINSDIENSYNELGFLRKIKDKRRISIQSNEYIKDLDIKVTKVKLPPNFHRKAYLNNLCYAKKICKAENVQLAPKTLRVLDYDYFNGFQKRFLAFSVIKSIQLILRMRNKDLKNSCIVIYDAVDIINSNIILELAKVCKYIVLLSCDLMKTRKIADSILSNFGVSPIVTDDMEYAIKISDFIVTSKNYEFNYEKLVWYLDNSMNNIKNSIAINDVSYTVPWNTYNMDFSVELLGAILSQMQETDIEKALKYNGIYLSEIKFNNNLIY